MIKNKKFLLFFIFISVFSIDNLENLCRNYTSLNFDNQALLFWEYSISLGLLPYKDIFYPYGLLNYFKSHSILFSTTYFFITPLLFTGIFFIFKKIFKDRLFSYFSFFIFFLFILGITGFETFNRYGILVVTACLFAYLFYSSQKKLSRLKLFLMGILIGIIFFLLIDQGIYLVSLFLLLFISDKLIRKSIKKYGDILIELSVFSAGVLMGLFPFFIYLLSTHSLSQFIFYLSRLSDITQLAKTPFIHSLRTISNIFTLGTLLTTIYLIVYKLFIKQKHSLNTYVQIALVLTLIILEQKSIIRSIDNQLSFIGLLLFIFLFYELKKRFFAVYVVLSFAVLFLMGFSPSVSELNFFPLLKEKNECLKNNIELAYANHKEYAEIKKKLKETPGFNGKIFSFPGDPVFYILFKQNPPYYPSIYEASSYEAQNSLIKYIQNQRIDYIIYNSKNFAIQDEVPNYLRVPFLYSYIFKNFSINTILDNYIILSKKNGYDLFHDKKLDSLPNLKRSLLQVGLENIPVTEGYFKAKYLESKNNHLIVEKNSITELNRYLEKNSITSQNKFIVIRFKDTEKYNNSFEINTEDSLRTEIRFKRCKRGKPCIVNISHLPIFYTTRILRKISSNKNDEITKISLWDISNNSVFW